MKELRAMKGRATSNPTLFLKALTRYGATPCAEFNHGVHYQGADRDPKALAARINALKPQTGMVEFVPPVAFYQIGAHRWGLEVKQVNESLVVRCWREASF